MGGQTERHAHIHTIERHICTYMYIWFMTDLYTPIHMCMFSIYKNKHILGKKKQHSPSILPLNHGIQYINTFSFWSWDILMSSICQIREMCTEKLFNSVIRSFSSVRILFQGRYFDNSSKWLDPMNKNWDLAPESTFFLFL